MKRDKSAHDEIIVMFDGVCNLCSGVVQFLIPRDPSARVHFASLQSAAGEHLRRSFSVPDSVDSLIAIQGGRAFVYADALIVVGRTLGGSWSLLANVGSVVPRPIRNAIYRLIAKTRYRMFGKKDECWLPTPALRSRFLPDG
jgi:predicted DCC family thiol-disulfide oxidoreductase YuxK